jgi:hypothetical protein
MQGDARQRIRYLTCCRDQNEEGQDEDWQRGTSTARRFASRNEGELSW